MTEYCAAKIGAGFRQHIARGVENQDVHAGDGPSLRIGDGSHQIRGCGGELCIDHQRRASHDDARDFVQGMRAARVGKHKVVSSRRQIGRFI